MSHCSWPISQHWFWQIRLWPCWGPWSRQAPLAPCPTNSKWIKKHWSMPRLKDVLLVRERAEDSTSWPAKIVAILGPVRRVMEATAPIARYASKVFSFSNLYCTVSPTAYSSNLLSPVPLAATPIHSALDWQQEVASSSSRMPILPSLMVLWQWVVDLQTAQVAQLAQQAVLTSSQAVYQAQEQLMLQVAQPILTIMERVLEDS